MKRGRERRFPMNHRKRNGVNSALHATTARASVSGLFAIDRLSIDLVAAIEKVRADVCRALETGVALTTGGLNRDPCRGHDPFV